MKQAPGEDTSVKAAPSASGTSAYTMSNPNLMFLGGSKLRKQMGSSLQEHLSAPTSQFAVQQLEKMGWTAGTGLGKKRNGMVSHIQVKKREEQAGLGTEQQKLEAAKQSGVEWWKDSLGDTLAKLSSCATGTKNSKKSKKKSRKEGGDATKKARIYTDEELFQATGGVRFGMRAAPTKNLAKWRRAESDITQVTDDGAGGEQAAAVVDESKTEIPLLLQQRAIEEDVKEVSSSDEERAVKVEKKKRKRSSLSDQNEDESPDDKEIKRSKKEKKDKKKKKKSSSKEGCKNTVTL